MPYRGEPDVFIDTAVSFFNATQPADCSIFSCQLRSPDCTGDAKAGWSIDPDDPFTFYLKQTTKTSEACIECSIGIQTAFFPNFEATVCSFEQFELGMTAIAARYRSRVEPLVVYKRLFFQEEPGCQLEKCHLDLVNRSPRRPTGIQRVDISPNSKYYINFGTDTEDGYAVDTGLRCSFKDYPFQTNQPIKFAQSANCQNTLTGKVNFTFVTTYPYKKDSYFSRTFRQVGFAEDLFDN